VPSGAWGTRCAYCQADNLVALPREWVKRVAKSAGRMRHEIREAAAEERRERQAVGRLVRRRLVLLALLVPIFASASLLASQQGSWREMVADPARQLYGYQDRDGLALAAEGSALAVERGDCAEAGCARTLAVPLRFGERVTIRAGELPGTIAITLRGPPIGTLSREHVDLSHAELASRGEVTLVAPFSGWLDVRFAVPRPGRYPLAVAIAPR
jgi:hypothetical protein